MKVTRRTLLALMSAAPFVLRQSLVNASDAVLDVQNPAASYGQLVEYGIYRKNKKIGNHSVAFATQGNTTTVNIESKIVVTVLKVPVYRFNYRSTEVWVDAQLQSVVANTNDNGKKHKVTATREGEQMRLVDKDGKPSNSMVTYSSNHWNPNVLEANILFNTLTGKTNKIELENLGSEKITVDQQAIDATHYRLAGDLKTDVWYDNAGRWVQLRFNGNDGSVIEYRCKGFTN